MKTVFKLLIVQFNVPLLSDKGFGAKQQADNKFFNFIFLYFIAYLP